MAHYVNTSNALTQEWHVLVRDHTVLPGTHTFNHEWNEPSCLYYVSIHQMAPPEWGSTHPITAYYSFIDLGCFASVV